MFVIWFTGADKTQGDAVVSVSIEDIAALKFDVELFGIPQNRQIGHEVTVNFFAPYLNNDGVFYTDSNGLEMQRRQLNYRETWDLQVKEGGLNVTANYYPI